jgi:hypothetical protein
MVPVYFDNTALISFQKVLASLPVHFDSIPFGDDSINRFPVQWTAVFTKRQENISLFPHNNASFACPRSQRLARG